MYCWLPVILLAAQPAEPVDARGAHVVYATGFEQADDTDYDGWPDGWTRQRGPGFPHYVRIGIVEDPAGATAHCLRVELDGGAAILNSPPIRVTPHCSYLLQGKLKTAGLKHDVAYYSVTFEDARRAPQESYRSPEFTVAPEWQDVRLGPLTPRDPTARFAVIRLHVMPTERADLQGTVWFDEIRLARFPRLVLSTLQPQNLFWDPAQVAVTCHVSGVASTARQVQLDLVDVACRRVDSATLPLDADVVEDPPLAKSDEDGFAGSVTWSPHVPDWGYYTVRATLTSDDDAVAEQIASLAVMRPGGSTGPSEFGWSMTSRELPVAGEALVKLLQEARVGWLKYPVWCDPADTPELDRLVSLVDQLTVAGIETVGVLDAVPANLRPQFGHQQRLTIGTAFLRPEIWQPLLEPVLTRLSLKIRHWQLGGDADADLADFDKLEATIRDVRARWQQAGVIARLVLAWDWLYELPSVADPPWDLLAMSESIPLTSAELVRYASDARQPRSPCWTTFEPLPRDLYSPASRACDLVLRMLAAKTAGLSAIFVRDPFDDVHGLLNRDGTPGELWLPWQTTACLVSGATYLGRLQLPGGSDNYVFARDNEAVLVVWNESPVTETLYLGDHVRQLTVWGEESDLSCASAKEPVPQTFTAGPVPVFLTGVNLAVAQWRLSCTVQLDHLAGDVRNGQIVRLRFRNTFPDTVTGAASLKALDDWDASETAMTFQLGRDREAEQEYPVRTDTSSGRRRVQVDFVVEAEQEYHFSVYDDLEVGAGDIGLAADCYLDDANQLIVTQQLENATSQPRDFTCYLYAPGRRRLRQQLLDVGPGRTTSTFALPDGQDLVGKTLWLRLEEAGGGHVLNYRVVVAP